MTFPAVKRFLGSMVLFTALWFTLLAHRPLFDPDEGRYAEIPREMLSGGEWVIPRLNGLIYLEKPPLQYWVTAASYRVFGETEFAARFYTGLTGYLSLIVVFLIGYRLWDVWAGVKAVSLTAASLLFVLLGHQLTLDMSLSFWLLSCLACFLAAQSSVTRKAERAWMMGCWAAMAFAVLTKGLIGLLIPGATLLIYLVWSRQYRRVRQLHVGLGMVIFLMIAAPWFVMAARENSSFLRFFFIREHVQRFLTPIEHRSEPWWFYIPVLAIGILPWVIQGAGALALPFREPMPRTSFDARFVLWIWCAFVLVFFSLSDAKLVTYILPSVPPLALLCAAPGSIGARRTLMAGALLSIAASLGIELYANGVWVSAHSLPLASTLRPVLYVTSGTLFLCGVFGLSSIIADRLRLAVMVQCWGWFIASATILLAADRAASFFSARDAALALRSQAGPTAPIYCVATYDQSLAFYLKRTVTLVDYFDEFSFGLSLQPGLGIQTIPQFEERWRSVGHAYAILSPESYDTLRADVLPMHVIAQLPAQIIIAR